MEEVYKRSLEEQRKKVLEVEDTYVKRLRAVEQEKETLLPKASNAEDISQQTSQLRDHYANKVNELTNEKESLRRKLVEEDQQKSNLEFEFRKTKQQLGEYEDQIRNALQENNL